MCWGYASAPGCWLAWRDEDADPPALVVQAGTTQLRYYLRSTDDLHTMLKERGDWVPLGLAEVEHNAHNNRMRAL